MFYYSSLFVAMSVGFLLASIIIWAIDMDDEYSVAAAIRLGIVAMACALVAIILNLLGH